MSVQRTRFRALVLSVVAAVAFAVAPCRAHAAISFNTRLTFDTGLGPKSVHLVDVNHDGKPDLITANFDANTVSVLEGNGDGTFQGKQDFGTGSGPVSVAVDDIDMDGNMDIVTADYHGDSATVLFGDGTGHFTTGPSYPVGLQPWSVAVFYRQDSPWPNLAVVDDKSDAVSILLGIGGGTFGLKTDYGTEWEPEIVAVADFNGDHNSDLAVASNPYAKITLWFGDGLGHFGSRSDIPTGYLPRSVTAIDLDNDGSVDLITPGHVPENVSVHWGNGDGTFSGPNPFPTGGVYPEDVAVGDMDGDDNLDLVVTCSTSHTVAVLLGLGHRDFASGIQFYGGQSPQFVVIQDLNGDLKPDLAVTNLGPNQVSILLNTTVGATVTPVAPTLCISPAHPCVEVPINITRNDTPLAPMRAFSVGLQLTGVTLCNPDITQGPYLSGNTAFHVVDHGAGSYTVDCSILGLPCGQTAPAGTLFDVNVGGTGNGTGTVAVTSVILRNCDNGPIAASPGPPASITIDNTPPDAVTGVAAAQLKSGNDTDGTTEIQLTLTSPGGGATIEVYRAPFDSYPEYAGSAPAAPGSYPPGSPWVLTAVTASGQYDEPPTRGFWYYVAYAKDACDNASTVSNMTGGALNYFLGDVSDGTNTCTGDNQVFDPDMSFLGAHYGITLGTSDPLACLDVGPTTNYSTDARPVPDDQVGFEDLLMFAINYGQVSFNGPPAESLAGNQPTPEHPILTLSKESMSPNGILTARLRLERNQSAVKAIHAVVGVDAARLELLGVSQGSLLHNQGPVFFKNVPAQVGVAIDLAVLGQGTVLQGSGEVAVLTFRLRAPGAAPGMTPGATLHLQSADLRDRDNHFLGDLPVGAVRSLMTQNAAPESSQIKSLTNPRNEAFTATLEPNAIQFLAARPNPFSGSTQLSFRLPQEMGVHIEIHDVSGRLVRTVFDGALSGGEHSMIWDGRTDAGGMAGIGVYFGTFQAGNVRQSQKLFRYR